MFNQKGLDLRRELGDPARASGASERVTPAGKFRCDGGSSCSSEGVPAISEDVLTNARGRR
jgi:hypothetical protein